MVAETTMCTYQDEACSNCIGCDNIDKAGQQDRGKETKYTSSRYKQHARALFCADTPYLQRSQRSFPQQINLVYKKEEEKTVMFFNLLYSSIATKRNKEPQKI